MERILENSDKTEQQRYSSQELCNLDLAKELKKVKNELKTKGQDLDQVNFEKNQQIERAKDKIYQLEKDLANYAKRNNDLKAELRGLRNREEEPTVDMIRGKAPRFVKIYSIININTAQKESSPYIHQNAF